MKFKLINFKILNVKDFVPPALAKNVFPLTLIYSPPHQVWIVPIHFPETLWETLVYHQVIDFTTKNENICG